MKRTLGLTLGASAVTALALVQSGAAGPGSLGAFFFGSNLVRAEVVLSDGGVLHDYRIDRGRIRAYTTGSLTLLEKDGTVVSVPLAANAQIRIGARTVPQQRLRRLTGAVATTIRDGENPASTVEIRR